jgi:hypothetical protein
MGSRLKGRGRSPRTYLGAKVAAADLEPGCAIAWRALMTVNNTYKGTGHEHKH